MRGLYIHIPFCIKKCKYCDFNSFAFSKEDKKSYLTALFSEMQSYSGEVVDSIFIGGGTPTSLDKEELSALLDKISETFSFDNTCEFTVEANPKTLDKKKLDVLKNGGVNRLSIGVQSFNDNELKALGRIHTSRDATDTINLAKKCRFSNISIDLMSAIPNQTLESFKKSLEVALMQDVSHISCYSLILEEDTPLFEEYQNGKLTLADEDEERKIYEYTCEALENAGFHQYEISNFAKNDKKSRHNLKYWNYDEYIGLGLSAHSFLDGVRFSNTDSFEEYIIGSFKKAEEERLTIEDMMSEFMFLGLRKTDGVSKAEFKKRFNYNMEEIFQKQLLKFEKLGMITIENDRVALTHKAISVSNSIMCEFIL